MGEAYHIKDPFATYFLTFQVVNWIDIFTRKTYRDIVAQSFNYCIKEKGPNSGKQQIERINNIIKNNFKLYYQITVTSKWQFVI